VAVEESFADQQDGVLYNGLTGRIQEIGNALGATAQARAKPGGLCSHGVGKRLYVPIVWPCRTIGPAVDSGGVNRLKTHDVILDDCMRHIQT
jgi:hypothetical protein